MLLACPVQRFIVSQVAVRAAGAVGIDPDPYFFNEFLEQVKLSSVQAIEVYPSHAVIPGEFLEAQPCAVIAIWTKRGP